MHKQAEEFIISRWKFCLFSDGWCLEAFTLAQGRMLEELTNTLVMLVVGKVRLILYGVLICFQTAWKQMILLNLSPPNKLNLIIKNCKFPSTRSVPSATHFSPLGVRVSLTPLNVISKSLLACRWRTIGSWGVMRSGRSSRGESIWRGRRTLRTWTGSTSSSSRCCSKTQKWKSVRRTNSSLSLGPQPASSFRTSTPSNFDHVASTNV